MKNITHRVQLFRNYHSSIADLYFIQSPIEPSMTTILIADDHEIVRRGVRMQIEDILGEKKCTFYETSTCKELMQLLAAHPVRYAVLDLSLSDGNLFSMIDQIRISYPQTAILIYSMNTERIYAQRLMQKGVRGFISKQSNLDELEEAIRCLLNGNLYISQELKDQLFRPKTGQVDNPIDTLSDRELEVAEYIATGMGAKEIAARMNLDITTISTYRRRAFDKLEVENAIELKEKLVLYR